MPINIQSKYLKFFCLCLVTLFYWGNSYAQENMAKTYPIPLVVTPNTKAEISYTHEKIKNGQSQKAKLKTWLEIKSVRDNEFDATFTTKSVRMGDFVINEQSPEAASLMLGFPFAFTAASDGTPIKSGSVDELIASVEGNSILAQFDPDVLNRVYAMLRNMDEEARTQAMFQIPARMSLCQNTDFVIGKDNIFNYEDVSPIGTGIVHGKTTYKLIAVDEEAEIAELQYRFSYDPESVAKLALNLYAALSPTNKPTQKEIDKIKFDRQESAYCSIDLNTGWVKQMTYSDIVQIDGETGEEKLNISVKWID